MLSRLIFVDDLLGEMMRKIKKRAKNRRRQLLQQDRIYLAWEVIENKKDHRFPKFHLIRVKPKEGVCYI